MSETTQPSGGVGEDVKAAGNQVLGTIKDLIAKGNTRSIIVRRGNHIILDLPLTAGVVGTILAPQVAALGIFAALISQYSIEIRRNPEPPTQA